MRRWRACSITCRSAWTTVSDRTAWLGLGGNIGDPVASMRSALAALDADPSVEVLAVSRLYRTPPWGKTDQDWFFNACAVMRTSLSPFDLLDLCLATERSLKRIRAERWGPRTIDIDVLFMNGEQMETARLTLPHPRMTERGFVMVPLADIVPDGRVNGKSVLEWTGIVDRAGIEVASADGSWWRQPATP